jgi:prepilin signal peptidase PulO-like enzyme (type II secretory pathway)
MATAEPAIALALGFLAGLAAGEISRALAAGRHPPGWPDRLSWLLALGGAGMLFAHPAGRNGLVLAATEAALVGLVLLVLASDVRERAVYPGIVYPSVALAIATAPLLSGSLLDALLGAAACSALFAVFYLIARRRHGEGGLGAGDVSAAALLGAVAGLSRLSLALVLVSAIGAGMALLVGWRTRSLRASFPYAPALCLGALLATLLPGSR